MIDINKSTVDAAREAPIKQETDRRHIQLRRVGGSGEFVGPCPKCGGTDRFSINTKQNVWHCRQCQGELTGDVIGLVQHLDGCTFIEAVERLAGKSAKPKANGSSHHHDNSFPGPIISTFDYTDEAGTLLFQVTKHKPKDFRQRRPDGRGGWINNTDGVRVVPYRMPDVIDAIEHGKQIFIVEGEKDADRMWSEGYPATTNPRGAGNWQPELDQYFTGANVVVIGDNDQQSQNKKTGVLLFHPDGKPKFPGQDHAKDVSERLKGVASRVRLIDLKKTWPECPIKGDISDYLDAGLTIDNLLQSDMLVLSSAQFFKRLTAPDYLVEGIIQRRYMYSFTGSTGTGKTAITLFLMASVCLGQSIGNIEVSRGGVLYFAGENPDDILYRWIALTQHFGTSPTDIDNAWFVPGVFKFSEIYDRIAQEMAERPLALVIVDTSAAYFEGDDENSNSQLGDHARRMRDLIRLPGGPSLLINAHPGKYAQSDNLLPRGGGAFLAEVDGNLTCQKTDSSVEVHWLGKFRGPDFSPINFKLETVTHELLKDTKGRSVPTVVAQHISAEGAENIEKALRADETSVLKSVRDAPNLTIRERGTSLGWLMRNNEPNRMKVKRALEALENDGLVRKVRGNYEITEKGTKYLENTR